MEDGLYYSPVFGVYLAMPEWEAFITIIFLSLVIVVTVIGNILVIISVCTHTPLKITPNYFIVSLAMADLTVSACVLPFNVVYTVVGRWLFGSIFCKMWLTSDVLCCTASILNLCAIALDRYYALHDPIEHARRRTGRFVLGIIALVWLVSCLICLPPLIGWNDWPDHWTTDTPCRLTEERGYVVYSSMGSFFIPLAIIIFVYIKIFQKTRKRLRKRAQASNLQVLSKTTGSTKTVTQVVANGNPTSQGKLGDNGHGESAILAVQERVEDKPSMKQSIIAKVKRNQNVFCRCEGSSSNGKENEIEETQIIIRTDAESSETGGKRKGGSITNPQSEMHKFISEKAKISLSKERKAARTMAVIVTTFIVCWLPFFLMYVILPFCSVCTPSEKVVGFITWLGYVNSTLNPIIYTIFNLDFRVAFSRIILCKILRN